jgi:hypothetical protein
VAPDAGSIATDVRADRPSRAVSSGRAGMGARIAGGIVSLGSAAILGIGAWLTPASEGHGSHTQLGLPPCMWPIAFHRPCPTCGMTTAVAEAAHGTPVASVCHAALWAPCGAGCCDGRAGGLSRGCNRLSAWPGVWPVADPSDTLGLGGVGNGFLGLQMGHLAAKLDLGWNGWTPLPVSLSGDAA